MGSEMCIRDSPYDPYELLERVCALEHPNQSARYTGVRSAGLVPLQLRTPQLHELRAALPELSRAAERHLGADEQLRAWFVDERQRAGEHALRAGQPAELRRYARTGVPANLRKAVWARALAVAPTPRDAARNAAHYVRLVGEIDRVSLLTDAAVRADVRLALDDEAFFVFAEVLEEATLALTRDPWLCAHATFGGGLPLRASDAPPVAAAAVGADVDGADGARARKRVAFPPSGLVPFRGLASLACPLCYVSDVPAELYALSRALWARYWSGLHALSARRGCLLHVLKTFEVLVLEAEPALSHHLAQLGAHPTLLAYNWLVFAFVGYLEVGQVLLLWDRVIGYDTVDVLAVAAVAIFRFRRDALLAAASEQEVADALDDVSNVLIVPLMQDLLALRPTGRA